MLTNKQKKKYSYINKLNERELYQELMDEDKGTLKYKILKSKIKKIKLKNKKKNDINDLQDQGVILVDDLISNIIKSKTKKIKKENNTPEDTRFIEEDAMNNNVQNYLSDNVSKNIIYNTERENKIIPPYTGIDSGIYAPFK